VFVTCATCQLWLHSDCLQLYASQRVSNVVRLLVASLVGRPGLVITLGIVFTGAVAARHLNSEGFLMFGAQVVFVETGLAFVSERILRSTAQATVASMSASSSEVALMRA